MDPQSIRHRHPHPHPHRPHPPPPPPLLAAQLCEATFGPATAAAPKGVLYFVWQAPAADTEYLVTYDVAGARVLSTAPYSSGGLNSISAWQPPAPAAPAGVLSMSYYDTRPMELVSVDPATGNATVLLTLPGTGYVPYQGAQAWVPGSGTVLVAMGYNDPTNRSYYDVLLEIDAAAAPPTLVSHWLNETGAPGGLWSLDWAAAA